MLIYIEIPIDVKSQAALNSRQREEAHQGENNARAATLALALLLAIPAFPASAQEPISNLPRNQTLIVENPEGTIKNAGWFNIWAVNAGGQSTGLHQLAMDTFWYIDPQRGLDGVWMNSLASDKPIYNADFTEMTVKLRSGIFWSDGVEFTADDVVFTTELHMKTNGMRWSAPFQINVASVSAPDRNTVVFKLKKPNSRFHALFTVRWNAVWMMPKHIFEKVADPLKFDFNKPVSLGAYVLHSYDPNGKWFIWQARDDWQRTTLGRYGEPGPKYVAYVDPGPARQARDRAAQPRARHHPRHLGRGHVHAGEAVEDLARLVQGLPLRASRSDAAVGDLQSCRTSMFKDKRVRWALALLIDIKAVSMASYRGAATISAIAIPPTGTHTDSYHAPMEAWLKDFELDTGKRKIKPYNPNVGKEIADMLRPSMGDADPDRSRTRSRSRSDAAGGSPIRRPRPSCCRPPASPSAATTG